MIGINPAVFWDMSITEITLAIKAFLHKKNRDYQSLFFIISLKIPLGRFI